MTKNGKSFAKPGCLSQQKLAYERQRDKNVEANIAKLDALGLKRISNGLNKGIKSNCPTEGGKRKASYSIDDEDYQQPEIEEGSSSSSEDDINFGPQHNKIKHLSSGPSKNKRSYATHDLRDLQNPQEDSVIHEGATQALPGQFLTTQLDPTQVMPEVAITSIQRPETSSLPTKKPVRGPTRGKNIDKIVKALGKRIPIQLNRISMEIEGKKASSLASCLGEHIRENAPVGKDGWHDIQFGIKESIVLRATDKSSRGKHARGSVQFNHISGSQSFVARASIFDKLMSKTQEQLDPNVTNPLSEEQISIDVLGKRSIYVRGYGIRKTTTPSTQPQTSDHEVIALQQELDKQSKSLTTVLGVVKVLASKLGIDEANIPSLLQESTSGKDTLNEVHDMTYLS